LVSEIETVLGSLVVTCVTLGALATATAEIAALTISKKAVEEAGGDDIVAVLAAAAEIETDEIAATVAVVPAAVAAGAEIETTADKNASKPRTKRNAARPFLVINYEIPTLPSLVGNGSLFA
jgi:hypothetical protein